MTTLIAYQGDGFCVIAADSQTTFGNLKANCSPMGKIAVNGKFLIAAAGTVRGMNIIQHSFNPPAIRNKDLDRYMVRSFIPALRKEFIDAGYDMKDAADIASHDNDFIIAVNGTLYFIDEVYGIERNKENLHVSGTGRQLALGAAVALGIHESEDYEQVVDTLVQAVEAAIKFDIYSGDEVQIAVQFADGKILMTTLDKDE
jgi:ATP-dependent protease HslVU (ClpYQ) peptidase subunit